jgi:VWFA-related protein
MHWMKCSATIARPGNLQRAWIWLLVFALLDSVLPSAVAQDPTQSATEESIPETTLRSQSNVVLIPALVKDQQGGIIYGLHANDFIVDDDGVEQPLRLDEAPEGQPISLVVAIQTGRRASYEFPRMQGLKSMLEPLFALGTARVALVEFDSHVEFTRNFTKDASLFADDLRNLQAGDGGAAILDAVDYSVSLLKQEPEDRLRGVLLISETRDHGSHAKVDDSVAAIGKSNATIYALAFSPALSNILDTGRGTNKDEEHEGVNILDLAYRTAQAMRKNVPSAIASMTGGEYELFATRKKFEVRMNDFTNHLHSRYLLSIAPRNPHPGLHQIRVRLRDAASATVLARGSYWAQGRESN